MGTGGGIWPAELRVCASHARCTKSRMRTKSWSSPETTGGPDVEAVDGVNLSIDAERKWMNDAKDGRRTALRLTAISFVGMYSVMMSSCSVSLSAVEALWMRDPKKAGPGVGWIGVRCIAICANKG